MSLVPRAVESPPVAGRPPPRAAGVAPWLVLGCYLLAAVALTWRLWADPAGRVQTGDIRDVDLFAWFLRHTATAAARGRLPALVTTALNAPRGVNLMWNTSLLLPGLALAPVTLLAGPQASLTVLLTLGFAGSAASLFWAARRWGAGTGAAALGGAVYGFSPALVGAGIGHYHLQFAVLPPLIIDALLRICIAPGGQPPQRAIHSGQPLAGRRRWHRLRRLAPPAPTSAPTSGISRGTIRAGARLGLLTAAQLFTGEELLTDTAVAAVVLLAVLAASRPRAVRARAAAAAPALAIAAAVALLICGYALWVQFFGPLNEHSRPGSFSGSPAVFVTPPADLLLHGSAGGGSALSEDLGYLGWPLLVLLPVAAVWFWRDLRVRVPAVTWAMLEVCVLGGSTVTVGGLGYPGRLLPWHWAQGLPVLSQMLPGRLSILADGAAAAALAFSLGAARSAVPRAWGRLWPGVPAAVAVAAVVPLIPLPYHTAPVSPAPAGWQAAFARLRLAPDARVLVVPVPLLRDTQPMRWQATTGEPGSMIGGYFLGPDQAGLTTFDPGPGMTTARYLDSFSPGGGSVAGVSGAALRADLGYWRPAAVVAVTSRRSRLGRFLAGVLGPPSFGTGSVLAWRR